LKRGVGAITRNGLGTTPKRLPPKTDHKAVSQHLKTQHAKKAGRKGEAALNSHPYRKFYPELGTSSRDRGKTPAENRPTAHRGMRIGEKGKRSAGLKCPLTGIEDFRPKELCLDPRSPAGDEKKTGEKRRLSSKRKLPNH